MRKFNFMMLVIFGGVLLGVLACSAASVASYVAAQGPIPSSVTSDPLTEAASSTDESQNQYYRGMFDICVASGKHSLDPSDKIIENCRNMVRIAMEQKWFEAPSNGWHWPLPAASLDNFEQMSY